MRGWTRQRKVVYTLKDKQKYGVTMFKLAACVTFLGFIGGISKYVFNSEWIMLNADEGSEMLSASRTALETFALDDVPTVGTIDDILIESYATYSASACMQSNSSQGIANALKAELAMLPASMQDSIVARAVSDPCTDTQSKTAVGGSTDVVFAFWHVSCGPGNVSVPVYDVCIAVAGAAVTFAELTVGEITKVENTVVGHKPCYCSLFNTFCRSCPVVETSEKQVPIKEIPKLTASQHAQFAAVLQQKAKEHARETVFHPDGGSLRVESRSESNTFPARTFDNDGR